MLLNCDLGEEPSQLERDLALLRCVHLANIAGGGHAGDEATALAILRACGAMGIGAGAHPGYPDPDHFGRVSLLASPGQIAEWVQQQVDWLSRLATAAGVELTHLKPHGALYHDCRGEEAAQAVAAVAAARGLTLVGEPAGALEAAAARCGVAYLREGFADRRYAADGALVSRAEEDALITDPETAARQAAELCLRSRAMTPAGTWLEVRVQALCVHSDTSRSLEIARAVRHAIDSSAAA